MESDVHSVYFRGDLTIKYLGSCGNSRLKNVSHIEAFLFICNTFSCWPVLLFYM